MQGQKILDYIAEHGSVSVREINVKLLINGATARISDLRKLGYPISDRWEKSENGSKYKIYYMEESNGLETV